MDYVKMKKKRQLKRIKPAKQAKKRTESLREKLRRAVREGWNPEWTDEDIEFLLAPPQQEVKEAE